MGFAYWYMFPVSVVIATGIMTEVFGFASGLSAYIRKGLIDYQLGRMLLTVSIPAALIGTWLGAIIPSDLLKGILGVGLLAIATSFLRSPEPATVKRLDQNIEQSNRPGKRCINTNTGETICYVIDNPLEGCLLVSIGGLFLGMVSTGLGELC